MSPSPPGESGADSPDRELGPGANPYVDEQAATDRSGGSGPLFDETYRPGESGETAGLIAGSPTDPVLVAGVGYPLLGDLAIGTVVAYRVAAWDLPGVAVSDCSNTPIAAYQTISEGDHRSLVVVGPEKRGSALNDGTPSETPGAIHEYGREAFAGTDERLVERIGESAMGSNTVENVLVVTRTLDTLPDNTSVITVEPGYDSWGLTVDEFTEPVEAVVDDVLERVLDRIDATLEE